MKGWCITFIHGRDTELRKALDALRAAGLQAEAAGWESEPGRRPQVQVPCGDLEKAWGALQSAGVGHVPIHGQLATE